MFAKRIVTIEKEMIEITELKLKLSSQSLPFFLFLNKHYQKKPNDI